MMMVNCMSKPAEAKGEPPSIISIDGDTLLEKFRRAIVIDDDPKYHELYSGNLETIGVKTTCVASLDAAAQELSTRQYPLIFCDNIFEDRPHKKGSEFVRDEELLFGNAQVVLLTGYALNQIEDLDTLKLRGVEIIEKRTGHIEVMKHICTQTAFKRATDFTDKLEEFCSSLIRNAEDESDIDGLIADPHLLKRARNYLIKYMEQLPDQDIEQFYIMGRSYSPRTLVNEIGAGSQVAKVLIDQILDDILESD